MWNILLSTPEECVKVSCYDLIMNDLILWTKYEEWRITTVVISNVLPHVIREHLAAFFSQYGDILVASWESLNGG